MNQLITVNIFLLILSITGLCTALECYECYNVSSDNGEENECGDDPDSYPTITCDAEVDGARCIYIEVTYDTTYLDAKLRGCLDHADQFCEEVDLVPGFNLTNCYVCANDLCNRDETAPPSATKSQQEIA